MARVLVYSVVDRNSAGGAQAVIARQSKYLSQHGFSVTQGGNGPVGGDFGGSWACPLHLRHPHRRKWHVPSLVRLMTGLTSIRPDLVNIHFISEQALYFVKLSRLFRYRTVLSAHGSDILRPVDACRDILPELLREADAVTVVSRDLADHVRSIPGVDPDKIHLFENGVDTDFWSPAKGSDAPDPAAPPTVVAVGRLTPVKGFDLLIDAFVQVRRSVPGATLCLVGDGPEEEALKARAAERGLTDAVEFTGERPREQVRELLRRASAYVLSSRSEGMPLALLEAMACGLPVVATRVGGVPEVVAGNAGLLVEPETTDGLTDAMIRILREPELAESLSAAARRRALDFSSERTDRAYADLYARLLRR